MPECAATGCSKQVRNYARCPMHRAERSGEGVDLLDGRKSR